MEGEKRCLLADFKIIYLLAPWAFMRAIVTRRLTNSGKVPTYFSLRIEALQITSGGHFVIGVSTPYLPGTNPQSAQQDML